MSEERYVLATGEEGAERLRVLHSVHGPDTLDLFRRVGVEEGWRIADLGCGIGMISCDLARCVGELGSVVGVDASAGQIALAHQTAAHQGVNNAQFVTASAYETGLERATFDMVYCRFLLMHLQDPARALQEMVALLKPGGVLVVEDGDFTTPHCLPQESALERLMELYRRAGERQGAHFQIGSYLHTLVLEAGIPHIEARFVQPTYSQGVQKRLPSGTLRETATNLLEQGLATQAEIDIILTEMERIEQDPRILVSMVRVTQLWGRKPS